ncbi:terminase small subunit [Clostridium cadaveris]|uniref:terminase small subunit n=1 Tax=Clostridium cadaveris TaxID=1529 RepID=UPI0015B5111B|nr:terminase small subunit [Clostridium cadaveris]NWK12796.1 terminase small subunit [Clostridium cadaveris]
MDKKLTPKQQAFADYYIETGNATEAARRAGYKKPNVQGSQNLEKLSIKSYIEERMKVLDEKRIAKGEEVLQYLTKVMRGEEKDQFGLDASLQDRTKAAELLGKRYRLFTEKVEVDNPAEAEKAKKLDNIEIILNQMKPPEEGK